MLTLGDSFTRFCVVFWLAASVSGCVETAKPSPDLQRLTDACIAGNQGTCDLAAQARQPRPAFVPQMTYLDPEPFMNRQAQQQPVTCAPQFGTTTVRCW